MQRNNSVDLEPKTDAEIYEMFVEEMLPKWLKVLTELWVAFGKVPTADQLGIYKNQLGSVPLGILELGVARCIRDHRFSTVPTVHDVWVAIAKVLGNPTDIDQAMTNWMDADWNRRIMHFEAPAPVAIAVAHSVAVETESVA